MDPLINIKRKFSPRKNKSLEYSSFSHIECLECMKKDEEASQTMRQTSRSSTLFAIKNTKFYTKYGAFVKQ
jgi:hypothetical protein